MAWDHNWAWHLKVLCSEVSDENNFCSRKADLSAKKGLKTWSCSRKNQKEEVREASSLWRSWLSGGGEQRQDHSTTAVRRERLANFMVCQTVWEIEQPVCQESWHAFQPNCRILWLAPITLFSSTWLHSFLFLHFKSSSWASFPFADAYA